MGNLTLQEQKAAIMNEPNYTPEQKLAMLDRLLQQVDQAQPLYPEHAQNSIKGTYQRMTDIPPEEKPKTQEEFNQELSQYEQKKRVSKYKFKPTFTKVSALNTVKLRDGQVEVSIRKLVLGDYGFLASRFPRWHRYVFGDDMPFDPLNFNLPVTVAISMILSKAIDDWEVNDDGSLSPSEFSADVIESLIFLTGTPSLTVEDVLMSELDEVISLGVEVYKQNIAFFTKILERSTIGTGILNLIRLLSGDLKTNLVEELQKMAEKMKERIQNKIAGNGGQEPGGEEPSLSQSPRASKAGQKQKSKA
jgi:hypothetical protein